jgi:hypothetical protein
MTVKRFIPGNGDSMHMVGDGPYVRSEDYDKLLRAAVQFVVAQHTMEGNEFAYGEFDQLELACGCQSSGHQTGEKP